MHIHTLIAGPSCFTGNMITSAAPGAAIYSDTPIDFQGEVNFGNNFGNKTQQGKPDGPTLLFGFSGAYFTCNGKGSPRPAAEGYYSRYIEGLICAPACATGNCSCPAGFSLQNCSCAQPQGGALHACLRAPWNDKLCSHTFICAF